jgi:hypothetical protein
MLRKLTAAVAVLLCVAGFGLAATAPAQATSVLPTHGSYTGNDHASRTIRFHFSGNQLSGFYVGSQLIGDHHTKHTAHVSGGMWHETCHGGWCTKGHWQTDFHVVGSWRNPQGHWTPFSASVPPPPHRGDFMGTDHQNNSVHVTFNGHQVHDFTVNGHGGFPSATVSNGAWHEVCSHTNLCFKGHFMNNSTLVGQWRHRGGTWHSWEAYAYSY